MNNKVLIENISYEYVPALRETLDVVCKEMKYLAFVEAPPLPVMQIFVKNIIENGHVQKIAVKGDMVVGWCDILINENVGFTHCGKLGMGVLPEYRGIKIGTELLNACLSEAKLKGLKKIELEVFNNNLPAIGLYLKNGFIIEGKKAKARFMNDQYDDIILMALFLE